MSGPSSRNNSNSRVNNTVLVSKSSPTTKRIPSKTQSKYKFSSTATNPAGGSGTPVACQSTRPTWPQQRNQRDSDVFMEIGYQETI